MLGINICSAIEELNKSNVLHRDIKPGNIFVNNSGIFQLGDFGIARHVRETTDITRIGTHGYIDPEVLLGHGVGTNNKVDMYALGMVLYELLNLNDLPKNKFDILPPKDGSPSLKKTVLKACAFRPEDRFVDINQMKSELISIITN